MASQGHVPGPAQIFISQTTSITWTPPTLVTSGATWSFLGYSENGVEPDFRAAYEDIYSDPGGPSVPIDQQFMGEEAWTTFVLNKYDEAILTSIMKRRVGSGVVAGAIEANGLGSLMIAQGYIFSLLIMCPYAGMSWQTGNTQPCFAFAASYLADSAVIPLSIRLKRPRITIRSVPVVNTTLLQSILYNNVAPSPAPTPD